MSAAQASTENAGQSPRLHVRKLSDQELLRTELTTSDPLSLLSRSTVPPPDDQELIFEMAYKADAKVQCVFGHWHKKGIVLRDTDGRRYLVGNKCGRDKYGIEWNIMDNARQAQIDRRDYLLRLVTAREGLKAEANWLRILSAQPSVLAFDALRRSFAENARPLYQYLARGSGLWAEVDVRDHAAEERRRELDEDDKRKFAEMSYKERANHIKKYGVPGAKCHQPLFKKQLQNFGEVRGGCLFKGGVLQTAIDNVTKELLTILPGQTQPLKTAAMRSISMDITRLLRELEILLNKVDEAIAFFDLAELDRLVRWANAKQFPGLTFSTAARELRVRDDGELETRIIARSPELESVDKTPLLRLMASIGAA